MTDKDRDLVEELLAKAHPSNVDVTDRAAARIQTQAREIERLREALAMCVAEMMRASGRLEIIATCNEDRRIVAALSGTCDYVRSALGGSNE